MMRLLVRFFVKDHEQTENEHVRKAIGNVTATVGVINNVFFVHF